MLVKRVIRTSQGDFTFEGNLSQEELDIVITVGLGVLLEKGAMPLLAMTDEEEARLMIPPTTETQ